MKILNIGSINIDYVYFVDEIVKKGETISSNELKIFTGGKGFNQSLAIKRAGVDVYHFGKIGKDGIFVKEKLSENGVNTDYIIVDEQNRTGNAIIQKDNCGNNSIILFPGSNNDLSFSRIKDVINYFDKDDFIIVQNETNHIPEIVKIAKKKGMIIFFNPSPLNEKVFEVPLEKIDYFILNEIEAKGFLEREFSKKDSSIEIAKKLIKKFPKSKFVLTLGEKGSIYIDENNMICQNSFKVNSVDTTGAGDTFTGYFIAGINKKEEITQVMENASIAASISVTRLGAEPSIPTIEEVKNFINK